jgi:hypothetical protein
MPERVDLFDSTYQHFSERVHDAIRKATYGTDIGQNSWLTVDEYERWLPLLGLGPDHHALEVASGSGGPALHLARTCGCRVTGLDANASGVATAARHAEATGRRPARASSRPTPPRRCRSPTTPSTRWCASTR